MKKYIFTAFSLLIMGVTLTGCYDDDKIESESVITVDNYVMNDFDKWLEKNYCLPYNISFKYRYEEIESDFSYYTVPAELEKSIKMSNLVKYLCIETYNEVAGIDFTRANFPKMFFLIGTWEYENNGTFTMGTAEGGKKILLAGINFLTDEVIKNMENLNGDYIQTIHHEFTHILNQTREFPTSFKEVTGSKYVADSWSTKPYSTSSVALKRGFITSYAQMEPMEDFAELVSEYITHDANWWAEQLKAADALYTADVSQTITGKVLIEQKFDIVRAYMRDVWGIDIDELRSVIMRRQQDIVNGRIDLSNIKL